MGNGVLFQSMHSYIILINPRWVTVVLWFLCVCVCMCVCMYRYTAPHPVAKSLQFRHTEVSHVMSTKVIIFRFAEKALLERKSLRELYV